MLLGQRVAKMEEQADDEYEIRQQVRPPPLVGLALPIRFAGCHLNEPAHPLAQKRVHAESLQMISDSEKRLAKAISELDDLVVSRSRVSQRATASRGWCWKLTCPSSCRASNIQAEAEDDLAGSEELANAQQALKLAQPS